MPSQPEVVVIGAGVGGLTTAALLLREGFRVTVLEAHVYPGGSAGTFYHQGYRFDAGATLAGGFGPGDPHARVADLLNLSWPTHPVDPAWIVHLPDGSRVTQWSDAQAWRAERQAAFPGTEPFWRRQEMLADVAWDMAQRLLPWPPQRPGDLMTLARGMKLRTLRALPYLWRTVADLRPDSGDGRFGTFLDAQLLISAQTTADRANALYGSAALDLPRRGVNHVKGGIGAIAGTLVSWIREHGGEVLYRQQVERIETENGRALAAHTNKGLELSFDWLVANVTPWSLSHLLGAASPGQLEREIERLPATWGAFTLYLGLDSARLPPLRSDHHQVVVDGDRPLGEGNTVFISLSDPQDETRAPSGHRAATLSTHTRIAPWWELRGAADEEAYMNRRQDYTKRLINAAERAIPGIAAATELTLPGTPVTFSYYTRRPRGMVGGFPQQSLFDARGPATGIANVRLVGDSIFPGQSTAAVTLGAMRVAADIIAANQRRLWPWPKRGRRFSTNAANASR